MTYSQGFKINVNKLNADENVLALVVINHPFIPEPIRLVNDSRNFVLDGETYLAMPFTLSRQSDVQGELPRVSLTIANIGRSLIKWIDSTNGGRDAEITVLLARRSLQVKEEEISFGISSVSINSESVNFNLVIQNNLIKRSIRWIYDKDHAAGLF